MSKVTAGRQPIRVRSFNHGQDSSAEPTVARENHGTKVKDTIITKLGEAEQREGLARIGDNPDTLISRWTFNNSTVVDDKGTNHGTASSITYVDGKFGKCASFNGTTSYISVPADSTIDVNSTGPLRLSAWIYVDSDGEGNVGRIIDKFSGTDVGYRLWVHSEAASTVKLSFEVGYVTTNAIVITSTTMPINTWVKIDGILNSDDSADIYINGVLASYSTDTSGVGGVNDDSAVLLYLGNNSAGSATFDGELDDVRVYDGAFAVDDVELNVIQGIYHYSVGSTKDIVVRIKNTDLQKLDADFKGWTNIDTGFTADKTTNFVQALDKLFILNGTDNVHSMDSAESITDHADTNTSPPLGTFGDYAANNRMFVSGHLTDSLRDYVWFSDALAPQTFDRGTNVFKVRSGDGGKITWLKQFKEFELIIYKNDSIYVLNMSGATPLSDWELKPLATSIGCPAGRTVQDIGNDHMFLSTDGFRLLSRTSFDKLRVGVISESIQDVIDTINQDAIQNSVAWFENGLYIAGIPTGTSTIPNQWVIWDSISAQRNNDPNSAWSIVATDRWKLSCLTSFGFGDNIKTVVGGSAEALSLTYKLLSGNTDDGWAVSQELIGIDHDFGDRSIDKIFDPLQIVAQNGSDGVYQVDIEIDRGGFVNVGNTGTLSGSLVTPFTTPATTGTNARKIITFRTKHLGRGKAARVRITNTTYNKKPTFVEYTLYAQPKSVRIT
jgi:hypothetical protein